MASDAEAAAELDRRAVVGGGAAMIGLGLLTAACAGPAAPAATAPPSPAAAPTTEPPTTAAPTTAAPTTAAPVPTAAPAPPSRPAPAPAPRGVPLAKAAAVPVGGGAVFPGARVVVTQPKAGTFVGLSATCTHQGCTVGSVSGGTINCPCHGSRFRLDGSVARGPATRPLARRSVTVVGDEIVLG